MRITRPPYKGISHSLMQSATNHVSLVFGLSGRFPLESSTAAGYNGERHLLPTKTGKMEVGSETECE